MAIAAYDDLEQTLESHLGVLTFEMSENGCCGNFARIVKMDCSTFVL
jgi:hypothetical protein